MKNKNCISCLVLLLLLLLLAYPGISLSANTLTPSFNCEKTESDAEELVCTNKGLAQLDLELARLYKLAINDPALDEKGKKYLRAIQRGWIKGRDESWKTENKKRYVSDVYLLRIAEIRRDYPASRTKQNNGISEGPVNYTCSQDSVTAYFIQTELPTAVVFHNDQATALELTESGSGAKYIRDYTDSKMVFWTKGDDAMFSIAKSLDLHCRRTRE